jgi:hypothetical protein
VIPFEDLDFERCLTGASHEPVCENMNATR